MELLKRATSTEKRGDAANPFWVFVRKEWVCTSNVRQGRHARQEADRRTERKKASELGTETKGCSGKTRF